MRGFVQFTCDSPNGLILDLPVRQMTDDESARAKTFFSRLGVSPRSIRFCGDVYNIDLDDNVDRGAELALAILTEVFRAPAGFKVCVSAG